MGCQRKEEEGVKWLKLRALIAQTVGDRIVGWMSIIDTDGETRIMSQSYKVRIEDGSAHS